MPFHAENDNEGYWRIGGTLEPSTTDMQSLHEEGTTGRSQSTTLGCDNNNNSNSNSNNNIQDVVYGAVIMAEPLREFTRFI